MKKTANFFLDQAQAHKRLIEESPMDFLNRMNCTTCDGTGKTDEEPKGYISSDFQRVEYEQTGRLEDCPECTPFRLRHAEQKQELIEEDTQIKLYEAIKASRNNVTGISLTLIANQIKAGLQDHELKVLRTLL